MKNLDEKLQLYLEKARKYFPRIQISQTSYIYNKEIQDEPTSGEIELNGSFLNEEALENNNSIQFIHYTSLQSAMNILNSGKVRLYNCFNLNDPSEIKYLLDKSPIDFNKNEIEKFKREHFILSGSLYESENDEDFNLWRLYGDNGRGVALVFEINENVKNWNNVYLQKVSYEEENTKSRINDYFNFHKDYNEKHKLFENKPDFFPLLATGVKHNIWSIEKEFRIVVNSPFEQHSLKPKAKILTDKQISSTLNHEYKSDGRLVSFVEIPIHLNNSKSHKTNLPLSGDEIDVINYVPNLKTKKLILGPNCPLIQKSKIRSYKEWINDKMNYDFEYNISVIEL